MNELQIKGNWNELKGKVKQKYGDVVDDPSIFAEGQADEIIGKIQKASGKTKEAIIREINAL